MSKLSATSIAAFKACPTRYRLGWVEGLRPLEDTDALRTGSAWHKLHEVHANGEDVSVHLDKAYASRPEYKSPEEWGTEQEILAQSFAAYLEYYKDDELQIVATELPFDLPLHEPLTGMPLSETEVSRTGRIDAIVRRGNSICPLERKSTSQSLDADSEFWLKWSKDTQVSMYALAMFDMQPSFASLLREGDTYGNILVDVWKKPVGGPKMLTQAASAEFVNTGEYFGVRFDVFNVTVPGELSFQVNGIPADVELGKKAGTYAIRETIAMFGARLAEDLRSRPEFYFQRREIARTDKELAEFRTELYNIYRTIRAMTEGTTWFSNFSACDALYRCQYKPICFGCGASAVCDGETIPDGFRRWEKIRP